MEDGASQVLQACVPVRRHWKCYRNAEEQEGIFPSKECFAVRMREQETWPQPLLALVFVSASFPYIVDWHRGERLGHQFFAGHPLENHLTLIKGCAAQADLHLHRER